MGEENMLVKIINEENVNIHVSIHIPIYKTHVYVCASIYIPIWCLIIYFILLYFLLLLFLWLNIMALSRLHQPEVKVESR